MYFILSIVICIILTLWSGTLVMAIIGMLGGVKVREISFGGTLFSVKVRDIPIRFGLYLIGSHVKFADSRYDDIEEQVANSIDNKSGLFRFIVTLPGIVIFFLPILLFTNENIPVLMKSLGQIFSGALSPTGVAQILLDKAYSISQNKGILLSYSIISAKVGCFMLIPFSPVMGMGQSLRAFNSKPVNSWVQTWCTISLIIYMGLLFSWGISIVIFCS